MIEQHAKHFAADAHGRIDNNLVFTSEHGLTCDDTVRFAGKHLLTVLSRRTQAKALDVLWDNRLDAASCAAQFETTALPRYLVADGWPHIFEYFGERIVRFVLDLESERLVHLQQHTGVGWRSTSRAQRAEVEDSLRNGNEEALGEPEDYGLIETDILPEWAEACRP